MGQTHYPSKCWVLKTHFSFKVRQHSQQQLYRQYKGRWILYKMVRVPSFSQLYLCKQPMLQSPVKSSTSVNFHLPVSPLPVHKIILTIPTNTPFLYISAILHLLFCVYNHPNKLHQNVFPTSTTLPIQVASRDQGARGSFEDCHLFPQSMNRANNHWFFIAQTLKIGILQV